jgi:hypothetical protein
MTSPGRWVPRVAGVAGGCGTTVIADGLGGEDRGKYRAGSPVDVLVCRASVDSLGAAQVALSRTPTPPVLVVVDDVPGKALTRAARARLRLTEPHAAGVVRVPYVPELRQVHDPAEVARQWRANPPPRHLDSYAEAMGVLAEAMRQRLAAGPPAVVLPVPDRGLHLHSPARPQPQHVTPPQSHVGTHVLSQPLAAQPSAAQPGAGLPWVVLPRAVPPGAVPPGAVPPGAVPPGAVPPGAQHSTQRTALPVPPYAAPPPGQTAPARPSR